MAITKNSKSLCTDILIRLSARDYDAITRAYNIIRGMVGGAGGHGDGLPMVSRVS